VKYRVAGLLFCMLWVVLAGEAALADEEGVAAAKEAASPEAGEATQEDPEYRKFSEYMDEHVKVMLGAGLRTSVRLTEKGAPNGHHYSNAVNLDNARFYVSGKALDYIGFEFNTEIDSEEPGAEDIEVLDAVVKFEFDDLFNVWGGRLLPPSDRSNLDGPYYLSVYDFPFVQAYPSIFAGRDNGVAVWGQVGEGQFKWQGGVFEGTDGPPNAKDHLMWAGRLVLNLLDPEPGYYNASTYYGAKDVLAIGVSGMVQEDAVGTTDDPKNFFGFNLDVLFEKKLEKEVIGDISGLTDGVVTLEGAYYVYDDDDLDEEDPALTPFGNPNRQGQSFLVLAAFLFPGQFGAGLLQGQFQPYFRFQEYDRSSNIGLKTGVEGGVNYVINGHNARLSLFYQNLDAYSAGGIDSVALGGQFQF